MKKHYPQFSLIGLKNFFVLNRSALTGICIALLFFMPLSNYAQKNKTKDFILTACVQDLGNGMYQVTFSYDNPNTTDITVTTDKSYFKKNGKMVGNGVNRFKRGYIINAFRTQFYKTESVEWTVINPNGKIQVIVAKAGSALCPTDQVSTIIPVYGQGDGKDETKLGSELTALAQGNAGENPSDVIYFFNPNDVTEVLLEITPQAGQLSNVLNLLSTTFGRQYNTNLSVSDYLIAPAEIVSNNLAVIDVYFPRNRLAELNSITNINFVRPLIPSFTNSGIVTSKGDKAQKSEAAREAFRVKGAGDALVKVNGNGIKVGVISDSYDKQPFTDKTKATVDVEQGDLPGTGNPDGNTMPVDVLMDYPYGVASDEGRAMLQIVHDVAPGAELAFHTGVLSPRNFELAIQSLQAANCDIIVDDITFPLEPFFGTGRISTAIKNFTNEQGNLYFTSAGNFANDGYQGVFTNSTSTPGTNFLPAGSRAHVYGGTDVLQKISVETGVYMIVLQWDEFLASQENSTGAITDLDIYLVDDSGRLIVGNNRINQAGDPTEVIVFEAKASGTANIMIASANGPAPAGLAFRYIAFRSQGLKFLEYGGAPTVSGHAMTPEANTIAAIDYRVALNPTPQFFSSYGGSLSDNSVLEIDLAAPDGGNTTVQSVGQDIEGEELINGTEDKFLNFFGTSAAAPHAAGAFALLMSAIPNWYPDGLPGDIVVKTNASADEALKLVKQTATLAGTPDRVGVGLINLEAAFTAIAAKTAKVTKLIVEDGKTPSAEPFSVTIIGEFFPTDPKIIFDGNELEITSKSDTEIVAKVGTFSGNPSLQVQTNSLPGSINNGGLSDPLYFLPDGKSALNIIADNVKIEYGQAVNFTYKIEGLGNKTYESTGLPEIKFTTAAVLPYPDVNTYAVTPYFDLALTDEQKAKYQVNFVKGLFEVTKKELTIKPVDLSLTYGEPVEVMLEYNYDATGIDDNADFLSKIKSSHQADFYSENTLVLINKFRAVVNDYEILNLLQNGSWMSSELTLQNKLRAVVNGMNVIDLDVEHFQDYIDADNLQGSELNKFRAVVNAASKLRAVVNGQDLINGLVELADDLAIPNKLRAVVNETGLGGENDGNDYGSIFAVVDDADGESTGVAKLYANHLISGLDATSTEADRHYIFPGAFLSPRASNFNIKYESGRLAVSPKELRATTNKEINYGENPKEGIITIFNEFAFDDTEQTVFPTGIPYQFVDKNGKAFDGGEKMPAGDYTVLIKDEVNNYKIISEGKLTIKQSELAVTLNDLTIKQGEAINTSLITPIITGIVPGESMETVFPGGIQYNFINDQGTTYNPNDRVTGVFNITIDEPENYTINYTRAAKVTVNPVKYLVYPSPTTGKITVQRNVAEDGFVKLYNSYGYLLEIRSISKYNMNSVILDITSRPKGIYYIRVYTWSNVYSFTIIKV